MAGPEPENNHSSKPISFAMYLLIGFLVYANCVALTELVRTLTSLSDRDVFWLGGLVTANVCNEVATWLLSKDQ